MNITQAVPSRVLVVEDNYLLADAVCDLVRDCGHEVAGPVGFVEAGQAFLQDRQVDAAVVDINLHGKSSFPICADLQRLAIPFFFLTGFSDRQFIPAEFRQHRLLSKPIDVDEFRVALADFEGTADPLDTAGKSFGNVLLDALSAADRRQLAPRLRQRSLVPGQMLEGIYFPTSGLVSLFAAGPGDERIEVGMVGRDGMTGITALFDRPQPASIVSKVLQPGEAWYIASADLANVLRDHRGLHRQLLRHAHDLIDQMAGKVLTNGHATLEQRLGRWLLMADDRGAGRHLEITHQELADIFGVRRQGVTEALNMLEYRGFIRGRRRLVEIRDRDGLIGLVGGYYRSL
jgi:CRP-like cAMP-binding protein